MNYTLTVFTPSYNRAYTLGKCYESLLRQTSKDFIWLIVDDGSTDNTKELVEKWIEEGIVPIIYDRQENQGMHGAHNTAYSLINTELSMCCDSDDYLADDAVEKVITFWNLHGSSKYSGMIGLDAYPNGQLISKILEDNETTTYDIRQNFRLNCDYKLVFRSEILKDNPLPLFNGEKYVPLDCKYYPLDEKYKMLVLNEILCYVEYLPDGGTKNIIIQYRKNPKGFAYFRKQVLKMPGPFKVKFRNAIHYVSSSFISKNRNFIKESPAKIITILSIPFGFLLYLYIMNTKKTTVFKD
ncbi:glycosyltransferase family 2 protein [Heyndrickxia sp. MSNUG]|uniref:glycosyltransferase family 2 protein n=1 Tax=Heyndrickxia sp. MSNUG TaxID=3136677 RepID=UPI003C2CF930